MVTSMIKFMSTTLFQYIKGTLTSDLKLVKNDYCKQEVKLFSSQEILFQYQL